jgi:hypothetical protein
MQSHKILALCFVALGSIVSQASDVLAAEGKLAWNAATGNPVGYKLYYGQTSGSYQGAIDVGLQTSYSLGDLADGQRYYFSVKAYDAARSESGYSNEVTTITTSSPLSSPSTSLGAAYDFNEGNGNTVTDASGLGNHGTISGATWTSQGKFGKALIFDGVNDVVVIGDAASLDLMPNAISINTWTHLALTYDGSMLRLYVNG